MLEFYRYMLKRAQDEATTISDITVPVTARVTDAFLGAAKEPFVDLYKQFLDPQYSGFDEKQLLRYYRAGLQARVYEKQMIEEVASVIAREIAKRKRIKRRNV